MSKEKLKVGLLLDSTMVPHWFYSMIETVVRSEHSDVVLFIINKPEVKRRGSLLSRLWKSRNIIAFVIHSKLERKFIHPQPNAFAPRDISELVDCPRLEVVPKTTRFSDRIAPDDISKIAEFDIDVLIRGGFRILRGAILKVAKFGVWSFHHGDNDVNRGGPAGTWEVLDQCAETGVLLQILTEDLDGGVKLFDSLAPTNPNSIVKNRNGYYLKAQNFLPRKLKELHALGEKQFFEKVRESNRHPSFYYNRLFRTPNNTEFVTKISGVYWRWVKGKIHWLFFDQHWLILYKFEKERGISKSFFRFKRLKSTKGTFWADPFVIEREGRHFVFFEEYSYQKGKGHISAIELNKDHKHGEAITVLEQDYHLSYPFIFEDEGSHYMIPESGSNRTVELYQCINFPSTWKKVEVIFENISASDPTIYKKGGKYWMFVNICENAGATNDELFLFSSDTLVNGSWTPHPNNPIVSDCRSSRPAGKIFQYKGRIYRPAQTTSPYYGYGMEIMEIEELSENNYREKRVQSIHPNWADDVMSTHTLNADGNLTVIDARIYKNRLRS